MKQADSNIIQQEVILLTGTSFAQRQLIDRNNDSSGSEQLENACWEGALNELLPEIVKNKNLHVWQIWDTQSSLKIELSVYPLGDERFSINPLYFLMAVELN